MYFFVKKKIIYKHTHTHVCWRFSIFPTRVLHSSKAAPQQHEIQAFKALIQFHRANLLSFSCPFSLHTRKQEFPYWFPQFDSHLGHCLT